VSSSKLPRDSIGRGTLVAARAPRLGCAPIRPRAPHPDTPDQALEALLEGNRRHRRGERSLRDHSPAEDRSRGQQPFAAVITCADSRLSPTLIFDLEPGNLFVSRVAGNSVDTGTLGSTEFAVAALAVKVVVVLGHSDCGAVKAAIDLADDAAAYPPEEFGAIGSVVAALLPAIEAIPPGERDLDRAVESNASAQAADLASRDPVLKPAVEAGRLRVAAAVYEIGSGEVRLVEGPPS
jgi:carbonic anhydrase